MARWWCGHSHPPKIAGDGANRKQPYMQSKPGLTMRRCLWTLLFAAVAMVGHADTGDRPLLQSKAYLQVSPGGPAELEALFATLEDAVAADEAQPDPVVVVLHGPQARRFLRHN